MQRAAILALGSKRLTGCPCRTLALSNEEVSMSNLTSTRLSTVFRQLPTFSFIHAFYPNRSLGKPEKKRYRLRQGGRGAAGGGAAPHSLQHSAIVTRSTAIQGIPALYK
ncbi:MAG: hypothetical protein ACYDBV_15180 [Nitrospiria bacterium]